MNDVMLDRFYDHYKAQMRQESSLEKLIDGSRFFALEMRRNENGKPLYVLRRSDPTDGGDSECEIASSQLSEAVKGPKPFIPALLRTLGMEKWAEEADAMLPPSSDSCFLYDALLLPYVQLFIQFDWAIADIPDGFKLGVKFKDEGDITHYGFHSDVVALAIEKDESLLKTVLGICPTVVHRLPSFDSALLAACENSELRNHVRLVKVPGHNPPQGWL
jgi:hypothetical protein